tara:strand:- start:80 stop:298 length:219 start_codon:yes stop_codon:yes gene_type:complete
MTNEAEEELENYILDWHSDKRSHKFAKAIGMYLFQFIDQLNEQNLSLYSPSKMILLGLSISRFENEQSELCN